MRITKIVLLTLVGIYLAVIAAVFFMQRDLMFAPSNERVMPEEVGLDKVSEVTLETTDGLQLYSWYGRGKPSHPTILFFHGNSRGVSNRQEKIRHFMDKGYGIFLLGYPGYGGSEGSPSESAFIEAAELAYNHLRALNISDSDIIIYGESLGSAVAVQLAAKTQASALVLEAPMSSIQEIAQLQYPYLPIAMLLKDPFLSIDFISDVKMPILFVHGTEDEAIPMDSGRRLFEAANHPKLFHAVDGAGHNNLYDFNTIDVVHSFIVDRYGDIGPV